ncbi:MAG: glutamate racemase [Christensenellales bacterium]|jgi:glutamate racemase
MAAIGFFDSGIGGLAVLARAARRLPGENFLFLGDKVHAPYGGKSREEITRLAVTAADRLAERELKALVVACNTATSAAIQTLRQRYPFPVIGMEPALKPALSREDNRRILVLATPATLRLDKFRALLHRYEEYQERVISLPCPKLSLLVEDKGPDSPETEAYLRELCGNIPPGSVGGVVLGCTHYIFLRDTVRRVLGDVELYDGVEGTVNQLARQCGLTMGGEVLPWQPRTVFLTEDSAGELPLFHRFMEMAWEGDARDP